MTKKDLAGAIAAEMGIPKLLALKIVQQVFDGIVEALTKEGRIELRNFGVFEVKHRKPRQARNPRSGEAVQVPEKIVVRFATFGPTAVMESFCGVGTRWACENHASVRPSSTWAVAPAWTASRPLGGSARPVK